MMKRLDVSPTGSAISLTTTLGAWYANCFTYGHHDIAMFMNEQTRYAIPILLHDADTVEKVHMRLLGEIHEAIKRNGISQATAERVINEYQDGLIITPTADRSLLGTMNDLIQMCQCHLDHISDTGEALDWVDIGRVLNKSPHRPLDWDNGSERLIAALRPVR